MSRCSAVGDTKIEVRFDRCGRQANRLLELADSFLGVGRRQRGAEVRARIGVIRADANGLAQRGNTSLIVTGLDQDEAQIVVGLGEIGMELECLTKRVGDFGVVGAIPAEHQPEHVLRLSEQRDGRSMLALQPTCSASTRWPLAIG